MRFLLRPLAAAAVSLMVAGPLAAQSVAGPYLAARVAAMESNFEQAAAYYTRALARDPRNTDLMGSALLAQMALGRVDRALPIAQALESAGERNQVAELVIKIDMIRKGAWDTLTAPVEESRGIGPLVDGLLRAWGYMGKGEVSQALAAFEDIRAQPALEGFALYHEANALASVGDFEGAEAIFATDAARAALQTRRGVLARVAVLSQLERFDEALELVRTMFAGATDPEIDVVVASLQSGTVLPYSQVASVQDGFAEVFFSVAEALRGEAGAEFTLLYAQAARILRPDHVDALLTTAQLFESLGQYGSAIEVYREVPAEDPAYHAAELGRAAALRRSDRPDASVEVLEQLARSHGGMATVQSALGDAYRQQDRYAEAVKAYNVAVDLAEETGASSWFLLYARAISNERLGNWDSAEADFRAALEINPGQPQVLNYLGYSLVEKREKLDEALDMIERAVAASPDSGYIIDSLGWALYRLRRFEEAVPHMERAVELMPVDPVVNDHLGDVYWAVGRTREAEFQWARALSFVDLENVSDDADPDRIRRKLEVGLDQVLAEEGAEPLTVANDG
ncbi:tetratricopeptide repeat protein [uncultured Roseobacter sp.]|uniref:tetratricopeptide repeat protein n=1 Tax=uncultured Roseobacter sp. TaxID=114847 RepID=UPI002632B62B|nr:tetratricopeptide repeat protein [uncultured Roseobacter sp.]